MAKKYVKYKVWIHLEEEINEGEENRSMDDEYLPVLAGTFTDLTKAVEFMEGMDSMTDEKE